jgi:hypothetical protein
MPIEAPFLDSSLKRSSRASYALPNENTATKTRCIYFGILCFCLILGKYTIPDNSPPCVNDKVLQWLQPSNTFIHSHPYVRATLQIVCSLMMDTMFLTTFILWVLHGSGSRLIFTTFLFYAVRGIIQFIWQSPYTNGYWWEEPGFPSLVVPYGRGSDFFFSGHVGFSVICICENKLNNRNNLVCVFGGFAIYTALILMIYQVHYSIDIIIGAIVAHWLFQNINNNIDIIDDALEGLACMFNAYVSKYILTQRTC